jgi:hypothetical protein
MTYILKRERSAIFKFMLINLTDTITMQRTCRAGYKIICKMNVKHREISMNNIKKGNLSPL